MSCSWAWPAARGGCRRSDGAARRRPGTVRVAGIVLKWLRADKQANYARAVPLIRQAAAHGARIVCTTECFLDGYAIDDKSIPLDTYRAMSARRQSLTERTSASSPRWPGRSEHLPDRRHAGGRRHAGTDAAALIGPDGRLIGKYHKQYLEHEVLRNTPGHDSSVFQTAFGKLGVMICADRRLRVVVKHFCERRGGFLICPSGGMFGPKRNDPILQARSKENGKYIVFVHPAEFLVTGPDGTIRADHSGGQARDLAGRGRQRRRFQPGALFRSPVAGQAGDLLTVR